MLSGVGGSPQPGTDPREPADRGVPPRVPRGSQVALAPWPPAAEGPPQGQDAVDALRVLSHQGAALSLRLAMLLACLWRMDLTALGYTSRSAFLVDRLDLRTTWARQLVRLVESPLDWVKRAVARGAVRSSDDSAGERQ